MVGPELEAGTRNREAATQRPSLDCSWLIAAEAVVGPDWLLQRVWVRILLSHTGYPLPVCTISLHLTLFLSSVTLSEMTYNKTKFIIINELI